MNLEQALDFCARGLGLALLQQSAEGFALKHAFSAAGCFRLSDLRADDAKRGLWLKLALALGERGYLLLQTTSLICGGLLLLLGNGPWVWGALLASALLFARQRDHFNGGSDALSAVLLLALCVARFEPLRPGALAYIAVQATLSYWVAGVAKLKTHAWRNGSALADFMRLGRYALPAELLSRINNARFVRSLKWFGYGVIAFECLFPCLYWGGVTSYLLLGLGALFHLAVAWSLGLNRFWPVWLSAYPALLYFAQR